LADYRLSDGSKAPYVASLLGISGMLDDEAQVKELIAKIPYPRKRSAKK